MKKVFCFIYIFAFIFIGFLLIDNHNNKLKAYLYSYDVGDRLYILDMSYDNGIEDYYFIINKDYFSVLNNDYVYRNEYDGDYDELIAYFIKTKEYYTNVKPIQFQFTYVLDDKVIFDLHLNNGQLIEYIYTKFETDYNEGYSDGYSDGYIFGENDGYTVGENDGYSSGYNDAYIVGKSDGMAITYNYHQLHKVNDNLKDILDLENKKFYDNVGKVILKETDITAIDNMEGWQRVKVKKPIDFIGYDNLTTYYGSLTFDNFKIAPYTTTSEQIGKIAISAWIQSFSLGYDLGTFATIQEVKTALAGKVLYYQLANTVVYDLTDEEIAQFPSYKIGYRDGYKEAEGTIDGFSKIVPSVFGSIWLVVSDFLSIEIFGISLWSILLLFASLSLLILFLKLVF